MEPDLRLNEPDEPDERAAGHVEIEGLAAGYEGARVLDLDRLSIRKGEFLSILGPSGCGKTTLLNSIAGFVRPAAGRIVIDGEDVTGRPPYRRGLGMVFQNYALFPHMTVAANVAYGLRVRRLGKAEQAERVGEALRLVGLEGYAERRPKQLSGGQQQRVALARALAIRPAVLLLDEPLSNLDAKLRREMRVELRAIQRRVGTTMVFVTHDQEEALALSDRIAVLNGGRIEQLGTPDEVYRRPATRFVAQFIGAANVLEGTATGTGGLDLGGLVVNALPGLPEGERAVVAIRPERVRLTAPGTAAGPETGAGVAGTVGYRSFAGDAWHAEVRLADGRTLSVRIADTGAGASDPPGAGTPVVASWDPADVIVLERGGASRPATEAR
ncbi:ABC transporter ATP-binding protein [Nonomuraea sp. MG754425]|uniref:ABC transporter ATP-binding protein n=1 Tax=Nonomuraea sp. MG754425 TaxID=2570319 RepID=UPI001F3E85B1|nr:ABC transporter ATP-binding protein [Nonomuraea sp. MG754425]MCF6476072.1 ABC transporter ATP-binding protein [Nonomuraea sp. MG754425]